MRMNLTPIADAISRVFWFWQNQNWSAMLRENPISSRQLCGELCLPGRVQGNRTVPIESRGISKARGTCGTCGFIIEPDALTGTRCACTPGGFEEIELRVLASVEESLALPGRLLDTGRKASYAEETSAALRDGAIGEIVKISSSGDYDPEKLRAAMTTPPNLAPVPPPELIGCSNVECSQYFERGPKVCPFCGADAPKQARRIRSRHKPLTVDDIVEGGVYVPKRGNNKTPNIRVTDVEKLQANGALYAVAYEREGVEDSDASCGVEEFLALVARRVDA